jgi:uncharacterized cupin superfamily protein
VTETVEGEGYTVSSIEALGEGPGFRKIRVPLGITAFGANAIVLPAGYATNRHAHETQQELYFVHSGSIEIELGDGEKHRLEAGGLARVDAPVPRRLRNVGEGDAVYVCVGGADGYVGRDADLVGDEDEAIGGFGK